jgi:hypothetical protein
MRTRATTALLVSLLGTATAAFAQTGAVDPPSLPAQRLAPADLTIEVPDLSMLESPARLDELARWIADFSQWKAWRDQWGNKREPGWFTGFRERRQRPDPPEWLSDRCGDSVDDSGAMGNACTLLADWRADYAALQSASARAASTARDEEGDKTTWWEHLHLDVGWPAMQSKVFGVVGMHATTHVSGRLQVFVAPGAMLLNVPTRDGGRAWKLAANWGIAYRLAQFTFPGDRQALLHVNLAKAWLLSAGDDVPTKSTDFIGFSFTFKQAP